MEPTLPGEPSSESLAAVEAASARVHPIDFAAAFLITALGAAMWVGTLTAGAGHFAPRISLLVGAAAGVGASIAVWHWRSGAGEQPSTRFGVPEAALVLIIVFGALRAWPPAIAWPAFLDGGWYASAGTLVARQGSLRLDLGPVSDDVFVMRLADQRRAGIGVPRDEHRGFHAVAFSVSDVDSGTATPYHPPLYTSWLAIVASIRGASKIGSGALPWAFAWMLGLAVLARHTLGRDVAPWAVALAVMGPTWRFFAPQPFAEYASGALLLGALAILAMARSLPRTSRSPLAPPFIAGLLLGLAALTKLDVVPLVAATALWWWFMRLHGSEVPAIASTSGQVPLLRAGNGRDFYGALALGLGLAPAAVHAGFLAVGPTRVYYSLNLWGVRSAALEAVRRIGGWEGLAVAGVITLALLAGARMVLKNQRTARHSAHADAARSPGRPGKRMQGSGMGIMRRVLAFGPAALVLLFWLRDRPDGTVTAIPPSLSTILVWAVTPLGAWAALAGWVWLVGSSGDERPSVGQLGLLRTPLLPAAVASMLVLAAPLVTRSLSPLYVGRRLLPIVLPLVCILAAGTTVRAWRRGGWWRAGIAAAAILVCVAQLRGGQPLAPGRDLSGARILIERLGAYGGPDDLFVLPSSLSGEDAGRLGAAIWALNGRHVAVIGSPEPDLEALAAAVLRLLGEGRRVFWASGSAPPELEGIRTERAGEESVLTEVLAPEPSLPPAYVQYDFSVEIHELSIDTP